MLSTDDAIAVVGVAAKFPGARDVDEFWLNLVRGRESVTVLDDDRLRAFGVPEDLLANPAYVKAVSMVPDAEYFDARLFRMTRREAEICDPQIRLFLEVGHAAIENAGYDPTALPPGVGVFASAGPPHYAEQHLLPHRHMATMAGAGVVTLNHNDYVATTASYKLDLRGPSVTVLTACSSTLVALHLACQSLRVGDCDMALVGGADVEFPYGHGYVWGPGGVRSRDGRCRPFDAAAGGTVFGSGAGAVLVKRLSDALADHDHISAVIRGIALNNDGADKVSFGAPSKSGQMTVIMEAMALAGVHPQDVSYVEAHGTGTALGDPIEVAALTEAYHRLAGGPLPAGSCGIGSVKGNVGHLGPVAGMVGFLKAVLAIDREQLPPSINFEEPNPQLKLESTPFRVQDRLAAWPRDPARPRRAAVSSMGIGGSNVHVVIEEPPARTLTAHEEQPRVVVWSGQTTQAERAGREQLAAFFTVCGEARFADSVATLQHGRTRHPVRAAAVCTSAHDAVRALGGADPDRVVAPDDVPSKPRPVSLLFAGQGAQQVAMARGLQRDVPAFAEAFDGWIDRFEDAGLPVRDAWLGRDGAAGVDETAVTQPLLFAVEVSLATMWQAAGLRPAALLGHSIGELAAATVAGVFAPQDAARLVAARARAMRDLPAEGGMLAVAAAAASVDDLLGDGVTVAVVNAADQVVLAGPHEGLDRVATALVKRRVAHQRLRTSGAFHTPMLERAAAAFEAAFADVEPAPPQVPVVSAATGRPLTAEQAMDPEFWSRQLVTPVRFADALETLLDVAGGLLLEASPGQVLTGLARRSPRVRADGFVVVPTLPARRSDDLADTRAMLAAAARVWTEGHDLVWEGIGQAPLRQRVPVPGYAYQRERYWIDPPVVQPDQVPTAERAAPQPTAPTVRQGDEAPQGAGAEPVRAAGTPFSAVVWSQVPGGPVTAAGRAGTAVVLLPDEPRRALDVVLALQQAGLHTVRARPSTAYHEEGDEFGVRPGAAGDLGRMFDTLEARGVTPSVLVHATAAVPWPETTTQTVPEQLEQSFFALLGLVRHGLRTGEGGRLPALVTVVAGAVDVSGEDPVQPVKATLVGACRTLAAEVPWLSCKLVDVSAGTAVPELRDELLRDDGEVVVALRGRRRWLPHEEPLEVVPDPAMRLPRNGVYVITGGLGGLGLQLTRSLAGTGTCPRIALLGRRLPAGGEDEDNAPSGDRDPWSAEVHAAVQEATALGAQVRMLRCDVGDVRQLRRALDVVTARFGSVDGVFHLAGVAGNGMLQVRHPEQAAEVLRPKVLGTYGLAEALAGRPELDFLVLFSSRAAVDGRVGSGDYAAANAVLDLFARDCGIAAERVLSIDFPSWAEVGMAGRASASAAPAPEGVLRWETVLDDATTWALDEHRVDGRPLLPGTAHLDLLLRAHGELLPDADGGPAVVVSDVAFAVPLVATSARRVRVELVPEHEGYGWAVLSRPAQAPEDDWVRHVTGRIGRATVSDETVDLEALRARTSPAPLPDTSAPGRMFTLGPRWRASCEVRTGGADRLVGVRLPEAFATDLDVHPLHPALLDLTTGSARDDDEPFHVPFLYRRMVVHAALPAEFVGHVRRRRSGNGLIVADIDLVGADGRLLVRIEGYTMRQVDSSSLGADPVAAGSVDPAGPRPAARRPVLAANEGIPPAVGAELVSTLLSARTPEQVVVRPYRDGMPVPLDVAPAAPRPGPARDATATGAVATVPPQVPPQVPGAAVPAAPTVPPGPPDDGTADAAPTMERLRALWTQTLGVADIAADDDFFALGGNSLSAVELMSRVRDHFGVELNIGLLFDAPTLSLLTELLDEQAAG